jgi:hypothetical protein
MKGESKRISEASSVRDKIDDQRTSARFLSFSRLVHSSMLELAWSYPADGNLWTNGSIMP